MTAGGLRQILIQSLQQCFSPIDLLSFSCLICGITCLGSREKGCLSNRGYSRDWPNKEITKDVFFFIRTGGWCVDWALKECDTYPMVGNAFNAPGCNSVEVTLIYLFVWKNKCTFWHMKFLYSSSAMWLKAFVWQVIELPQDNLRFSTNIAQKYPMWYHCCHDC